MNNWHTEETYKSLIQISTVIMRFILTANGGAAIALLAFSGNIYSKGIAPPNLKYAMSAYLAGVVLGGLVCCFSYITQLILYGESSAGNNGEKHKIPLYIAMVFAVLGIISFGVGSWLSIVAFNF